MVGKGRVWICWGRRCAYGCARASCAPATVSPVSRAAKRARTSCTSCSAAGEPAGGGAYRWGVRVCGRGVCSRGAYVWANENGFRHYATACQVADAACLSFGDGYSDSEFEVMSRVIVHTHMHTHTHTRRRPLAPTPPPPPYPHSTTHTHTHNTHTNLRARSPAPPAAPAPRAPSPAASAQQTPGGP